MALRVAKWLIEKGRPDEGVGVLVAYAASGPNDPEGQGLLAEALRVDPSSRLSQMAFERMEGVPGDHAELDAVILRYAPSELAKLEAEMKRPSFRRAQMGFNNNIKFHEQVFHVQTEDSGLDQPHIITHLFADGGRVIKSHKRSYASNVQRPDIAEFVRSLMKAQHLEMVLKLRDGSFDRVIAGQERGGMDVLTEPPKVDNIKKLAKKKEGSLTPPPPEPAAPPPKRAPAAPVRTIYTLHVLRSLTGGPERYDLPVTASIIGAEGEVNLPGERFCHPREASLSFEAGHVVLEDLEGGNGVFLRIRTPVELDLGDEFVVGDQLLRIEKNPVADDGPDPDPTYFYSSPKWPSSFRVVQLFEGGAKGACVVARGTTMQIGSAIGDFVFTADPLVDDQHCLVEEQAGAILLTDLDSCTGVFVRIKGEQELVAGDEIIVGRTRLQLEIVN